MDGSPSWCVWGWSGWQVAHASPDIVMKLFSPPGQVHSEECETIHCVSFSNTYTGLSNLEGWCRRAGEETKALNNQRHCIYRCFIPH